ncbi:MAG: hypothetical protein ACK6DQ_01630, partial [Planctomycetota bacterium]
MSETPMMRDTTAGRVAVAPMQSDTASMPKQMSRADACDRWSASKPLCSRQATASLPLQAQ